jgi:hypothetical protein
MIVRAIIFIVNLIFLSANFLPQDCFANPMSIKGDLSELQLDPQGATYIVDSGLFVPKGKLVIVPAGTNFCFHEFSGLSISGGFIVAGTDERRVIFTSVNDTSVLEPQGSLSSSSTDSIPGPGLFDWNGIDIATGADSTWFNFAEIKHATFGLKCTAKESVHLKKCIFRSSGKYFFTINQKPQSISEGRPFSFNDKDASAATATSLQASGHVSSSGTVSAPKKPFFDRLFEKKNRRPLVQISLGTLAGGFLIAGIVTNNKVDKYNNEMDQVKRDYATSHINFDQYNALYNQKKSSADLSAEWRNTFYALSALSAVGLGITFFVEF